MVLRSAFDTDEGTLELLDAMVLGECADPHRLGEHAPHALLRAVHCAGGRVEVEMCFRLRPEYGLIVPLLVETPGGVVATGGPDQFTVSTPVPLSRVDGEARAFTQAFGSPDLDAAALMLPIVGFLPATDPRVPSTIDTIADQLTDARGLVYRYRTGTGVDGLAGDEGTFLLCTFGSPRP